MMIRRIDFWVAVCVVWLLAFGGALAADNPVYDLHVGVPLGDGSPSPLPDEDEEPPCDPYCDPGCQVGDPIYPASGKFYLQLTDLSVGGTYPIEIERLYTTKFTFNGAFGYGWTIKYNERLYKLANGDLLWRKGDGTRDVFEDVGSGTYEAPRGAYESLVAEGDGTFTMTSADGTERHFESNGTLAEVRNPHGDGLLFTYDPSGKLPISGMGTFTHMTNAIVLGRDYQLTRIEQARNGVTNGRYVALTYSSEGRVTQIVAHTGSDLPDRRITYDYSDDGRGDLIRFTDVMGTEYPYTYDDEHRMLTFYLDDCACALRQNTYDDDNRVIQQVIGLSTQSFEYVEDNEHTRITTSIVNEETGSLLHNRIEHYYFTSEGRTDKYVLQRGNYLDTEGGENDDLVTSYTYNQQTGEIASMVDAEGYHTSYTFNDRGNLLREFRTNTTGAVISRFFHEDSRGNLTNVYVTSSAYPGVRFAETRSTYDGLDRLVTQTQVGTNGQEQTISYAYAAVGSHTIETSTDPVGHRCSREYDEFNQLIRIYDPDNPAHQTSYHFDSRGNLTNVTDALGGITSFRYDELGRKTGEVNALGIENLFTFAGGNLVRVETGRSNNVPGRVNIYGYDDRGRRTATYRLDDQGGTNLIGRFGYDSEGKLLFAQDAAGYESSWTYDVAGRNILWENIYGGIVSNRYDKLDRVISTVNAEGVETLRSYDAFSRLTNLVEAFGTPVERATSFAHDPLGQVTETHWADGTTSYFYYDAYSRPAALAGARVYPTSFVYDYRGRLVRRTNARGYSVTNAYDAYGRLVATDFPDGSGEVFMYDLVDNRTSFRDANGNTTYYEYDPLGRLLSQSIPNNSNSAMVAFLSNPWHEPTMLTNAVGEITLTYYDRFGRITNTVNAAGLSLAYEYDSLDRLRTIRWPNDTILSNAYEGLRLVGVTDRAGQSRSFSYDEMGRLIGQSAPSGLIAQYAYDALGRLTSISNSEGQVTVFDYDVADRRTAVSHPDGSTEFFGYDSAGNVTARWGTAVFPVAMAYDAVGNATNLTDGLGRATSWSYDSRNRVRTKTYADGNTTWFAYDGAGNISTQIDALGVATVYDYNDYNDVESILYGSDPLIDFNHDVIGRVVEMVDGSGTNEWGYDRSGNITTAVQKRTGAVIVYDYDEEGHRTRLTVNGEATEYAYDAAGRLASISNACGLFSYAREAEGFRVVSLTHPNGTSISNTYDVLGRLVERRHLDASETPFGGYTFAYDLMGRVTNAVAWDGSSRTFLYDSRGQLTNVVGRLPGGALDPGYQYAYGYDSMGNRQVASANGVTNVYGVNAVLQYTQIVSCAGTTVTNRPVWDADGRLLWDGEIGYVWNDAGWLAGMSSGTWRIEFSYDGQGLNVETRVYDNEALQATTRHVYDGMLPVAELNEVNSTTRLYTRGLDLSRTLSDAGGIGGLLAQSIPASGNDYYFFYDGNGNVVSLKDQDDNSAAHYSYSPFGEVVSSSGTYAMENGYRFSTREQTPYGTLVRYAARPYSPSWGRWVRRDPIEETGGVNLYAYVNNDPINRIDPLGLAAYLQDGTWATDNPETTGSGMVDNLVKLTENYDTSSGDVIYHRGVGSPEDTSTLGHYYDGLTGGGILKPGNQAKKIVKEMYNEVVQQYNNGDTEIILGGWSRGAAQSMELSWMIYENGIPDLSSGRQPDCDWLRKLLRRCPDIEYDKYLVEPGSPYKPGTEEPLIDQVHLFDTVHAMGLPDPWFNPGWHTEDMPPNVKNTYLYKAGHGGKNPPLGFARTVPKNKNNNVTIDVFGESTHSDVAGATSHPEGQQSYDLMVDRLNSDRHRVFTPDAALPSSP